MKKILETIASIMLRAAIITLVGYFILFRSCTSQNEPIVSPDTVIVVRTDTLYVEKPTERTRYVVRTDTLTKTELVFVPDTAGNSQSVVIPIEQAVYSDSLGQAEYTAYVSGYSARLDSIFINCRNTEITITKRQPAPRWGVGLQLGVGVSAKGIAAPYIGIGVQYRLFGK